MSGAITRSISACFSRPGVRANGQTDAAYLPSRSGGLLGPESRVEAHGIAAGRDTDQCFRDDGDHTGQQARDRRLRIMTFFGKRQVFVFLHLHLANAVGELLVPARKIGDLLGEMLVDGALDCGGADDDTMSPQERRHQPEDCAANGPDRYDRAGCRRPGEHQIEESRTMLLLVLERFLEPWEKVWVARLGERDLRAIDRYGALLAGVIDTQNPLYNPTLVPDGVQANISDLHEIS